MTTASYLIIGQNGQLSRALAEQLGAAAFSVGMPEVDMSSKDFIAMLDRATQGKLFSAVFNAAAYTQVDKAEGEGREEAFRINTEAVGELAQWCKSRNIPLVHYSTDYVFDGSGSEPRNENAPVDPLNAYGQSKLGGEQALAASGADYLTFRTSWVYDAHGKNFFNTMLRLFAEKESLNVVADQIGAPTYAPHLAAASIKALEAALAMKKFPSGLYHLTGTGATSWHGFAQAILALATSRDSGQKSAVRCTRIDPIATSEYPLPAKRPLNSRLDCSRAASVLGVRMEAWETGLRECFKEKYGRPNLPD